ncbi:MAG TPA: tRNA uridine-5-carboxymethylaminomethyl(34) synthesis GTPase MnmE [Candidatus Thiothrix moscowensis]|uniref:tRNA uridine-5-carboxymethylaminomethyl(34) synthesis GTPase MnmE n=1 Tax=unclassified Thiothrix TaxID=2636184 RepID=UPI0025F11363|nr:MULTISPECIES: tRNA uridine-5-carboxymethylaminomethyl(34) synthesis GTPase MnmE [unclassified Thiothrix]HRJ51928.1 tRNA uridine-5-carboxymethylaminomethyl(34) synthesis GTPase MnmE [Candidatus Thiothrix moscowensis]HRJ92243.1 tRNA uridine-5-carboxymethylaminomethyl(34) synthesis GTPase MnmE [Candidatus Thiothrix moscowensis]
MWNNSDTIAAVATPPGRGGVGIIRISGQRVPELAAAILGSLPSPRQAVHRLFKAADGTSLDDGIALYFPAPHSFTGEDVLELQGHGGTVVLDMLLKRCVELGARLARPGEFSERAFLNDKLDLAQAEAIADLIDSGSEQAARSALRSLQGEFSSAVNTLLTSLIELRVYVEAALDFPDEEIDFLADNEVTRRLESIRQQLQIIFQKARQGSLLRDGMHLVIVGRPNAGKSSLLNALAGQETAIVTDIAGTTRDVLRERINLDGMPLHIVDTAGLRDSDDPVEKIGIERAWAEITKADLILLLVDDTRHDEPENAVILARLPPHLPRITVHNKVDLSGKQPGKQGEHIYISAKHAQGMDALRTELKTRMGYQGEAEDTFIARRRHLQALEDTQTAVERAEFQLREFNAGELMAEELRLAQDALGQITGRFTPDDLLGEIFSSFCIGK